MTTRRWMAVLVIVAVVLWGGVLYQRRLHFLKMVEWHRPDMLTFAQRTNRFLPDGSPILNEAFFEADGTMKPKVVRRFERKHAYFAGLVAKYRYAADHPWVGVEPDGEEPE